MIATSARQVEGSISSRIEIFGVLTSLRSVACPGIQIALD